MSRPETIYLYRRKGQDAFASCDLDRYAELYGHCLFETKIAYSSDEIDQLHAANQRLEGENKKMRDALEFIARLHIIPPNQSHGHVTPNADGNRARCGGPTVCKVCMAELAHLQAKSAPAEPVSREAVEVVGYGCAGQIEVLKHVPLTGGMKVSGRQREKYSVPLMTVAQHNRIVAALTAPPLIDPALTNSQCACGDEYAANSYGAGFMAANNGVCENCDACDAPPSPDAELVELKSLLPELDDALEDLELHGRHADQGYRKLKDWYRKIALITGRIDAKLANLK